MKHKLSQLLEKKTHVLIIDHRLVECAVYVLINAKRAIYPIKDAGASSLSGATVEGRKAQIGGAQVRRDFNTKGFSIVSAQFFNDCMRVPVEKFDANFTGPVDSREAFL